MKNVLYLFSLAIVCLLPFTWANIENFDHYCIAWVLSFAVYLIANNIVQFALPSVITLPKHKKFKGRVSPIYKIVDLGDECKITKYEVKATQIYTYSPEVYFLFLYSLFKEYGYVPVRSVVFDKEGFEDIQSLEAYFEFLAEQEDLAAEKERLEKDKNTEPYKRLNKTFNENYI